LQGKLLDSSFFSRHLTPESSEQPQNELWRDFAVKRRTGV
jgi:hypothetical protein